MNILFLAPQPFYVNRGTPIAVRAVLEGLSRLGHVVDVVTYHQGEDVHMPNVTLHRIRRPPLVNEVPIGPSWQKLVCDAALAAVARRLLRTNRYQLIHAVEEAAFLARWFRWRYGVPYVYDMDSLMSLQIAEKHPLLRPGAKLFERLERGAIRQARGVLAVCPALVDTASAHHPTRNVALLPDLPNTGTTAGELPSALTGIAGTRVMYVGNLERYQGVGLLLESFAIAAAQSPDAVLVIVGGSPPHIRSHQAMAERLGIADRVVFTGPLPVEALASVLAEADILVSPRLTGNNTPMKIYSYLHSGRPVIATRLYTHTQVLDEEVACLVEPEPEAMARGLVELIGSASTRQTLGERGRAYVNAHFSPEAFERRLRRFYEPLAQQLESGGEPTTTEAAVESDEPHPPSPSHS